MNALLFPCLVIGFTAWWGLLPDQVIMTAQNLSLLDPECIQAAKEALIESAPGIGTSGIEQAFDPLKLKARRWGRIEECTQGNSLRHQRAEICTRGSHSYGSGSDAGLTVGFWIWNGLVETRSSKFGQITDF